MIPYNKATILVVQYRFPFLSEKNIKNLLQRFTKKEILKGYIKHGKFIIKTKERIGDLEFYSYNHIKYEKRDD